MRRTASLETMLGATHLRSAFLGEGLPASFESGSPQPKNDFHSVFFFSGCIGLIVVIQILQQSLQYCLENLIATIFCKGAFSFALVDLIQISTSHHSFLSVESKMYSFPLLLFDGSLSGQNRSHWLRFFSFETAT